MLHRVKRNITSPFTLEKKLCCLSNVAIRHSTVYIYFPEPVSSLLEGQNITYSLENLFLEMDVQYEFSTVANTAAQDVIEKYCGQSSC